MHPDDLNIDPTATKSVELFGQGKTRTKKSSRLFRPGSRASSRECSSSHRPLALFDRDGTIIVDKGYQFSADGLEWMPGAADAIRFAREGGWRIGVITNQSAVARGICTTSDVRRFHRALSQCLQAQGAIIDFWLFCPFHADAVVPRYRVPDHPDRKPNPGLILRALERWDGDRERSFMIGDRETDQLAAQRAGIAGHLYRGDRPLDKLVKKIIEGFADGVDAFCKAGSEAG